MKLCILAILCFTLTLASENEELPVKLRLCFEFAQRYYERNINTLHQLDSDECRERLHVYAKKANTCSPVVLIPHPYPQIARTARREFSISDDTIRTLKKVREYNEAKERAETAEDPAPEESERHRLQIEEVKEICDEVDREQKRRESEAREAEEIAYWESYG